MSQASRNPLYVSTISSTSPDSLAGSGLTPAIRRFQLKTDEIPTPALLVDIDALDRNIARMADYFSDRKCRLRPHFKAHKTPAILKRQLSAGSCVGVTCATVNEAEVCAAHGVEDILIANEPIGPGKAARCAMVATSARLTVAIDSLLGIAELSVAAVENDTLIGAIVDINVGMPRCGVRPEKAPALAKAISEADGLEFRGIMGYEGHAVLLPDESRTDTTTASISLLDEARIAIEADGFGVEIVSGGGTGTYNITGAMPCVTELQAGSYALMDDAYLELELGFERALTMLTTIISRPSEHLAIADGGLKAFAMDHGNPRLLGDGDVLFLSDEHATLKVRTDAYPLGSRAVMTVAHVDPTVNLHDQLWAVRGDDAIEVWPVEARGYRDISFKS